MRGLYIHIPFCIHKCDYCDFVSYENAFSWENRYVDALLREFSRYRGEKVDTVYIGGGTPTSLKESSLVKILDAVFDIFCVSDNGEVTVECNPKTADVKRFQSLLEHGANRISIGVQSLDDTVLKGIGRIHSAQDAKKCIIDAKTAGFKNISADIMFGLPNQSIKILEDTVSALCELCVNHISCYGLILEENTPLTKKVESKICNLPDEDTEFLMYEKAVSLLGEKGFKRYEISNFSKEKAQSLHNIKYWECVEYIGCGAAAHSYIDGQRFCHTSDILSYIENPFEQKDKVTLSNEDKMSEFMMLGLRMDKGISVDEFVKRFGENPMEKYKKTIEKYVKCGLLACDNENIRLTKRGVYLSNTVLCEFM